jgi:hypothetical protein
MRVGRQPQNYSAGFAPNPYNLNDGEEKLTVIETRQPWNQYRLKALRK